jgi:D-glycero-alpha-D-manno-heptose-7-phosphate kinase
MIISKTPYRIPLSGGGTDLKFYYSKKNSEFISACIKEYVYVLLSHRKIDNNFLIQTTDSQFCQSLAGIDHDLIRETLKYFNIKEKLHIGTFSTVPTRTGLGTSSAMVVGLVNCIAKFKGLKLTNKNIYKIAYKIERDICKIAGGWQDQIVSTYGGSLNVTINKKEKITVKKFQFSKKLEKIINNHLLLVYTNKKRSSSEIIKSQIKNKKKIIHFYDKIKSLNLNFKKIIKYQDVEKLGQLFSHHWDLKKNLSKKITSKSLEIFYKKLSKKIDIIGSKLIGAGGGGFYLLCVKNKIKTKKNLEKFNVNYLDLQYESKGSSIINL